MPDFSLTRRLSQERMLATLVQPSRSVGRTAGLGGALRLVCRRTGLGNTYAWDDQAPAGDSRPLPLQRHSGNVVGNPPRRTETGPAELDPHRPPRHQEPGPRTPLRRSARCRRRHSHQRHRGPQADPGPSHPLPHVPVEVRLSPLPPPAVPVPGQQPHPGPPLHRAGAERPRQHPQLPPLPPVPWRPHLPGLAGSPKGGENPAPGGPALRQGGH